MNYVPCVLMTHILKNYKQWKMNYYDESPLKILTIRPMAKEDVWEIFRLLQKSWIRTITFITFCEKKKSLYVKMIAICFIVRLNQTIKLFWIGFHRAICLDVSSNWEPNQLFICRLSLGKADPKNEMPPMNRNHRFVPEFSRRAWRP